MRRLALGCTSFSAGVFLAFYLLTPKLSFLGILLSLLLSLLALFFRGERRLLSLLILLPFGAGLFAASLNYHQKILPARALSETRLLVEAEVMDYPTDSGNTASVRLKLRGENTPRMQAELITFGSGLEGLIPGDRIRAPVKLKAADERFGERFLSNNADNVYLLCYLEGEIEPIGKSQFSFRYFPKTLARAMREKTLEVFPAKTAPFLLALLTGDRTLLAADTVLYAGLSTTGVMHVIAVSGLHLAFLVGFIRLLVRRKRAAAVVSLLTIWLFVPFSGGSPSVVRAAFMFTTVLIAPILRRENDAFTSMATILALILLQNPAACASVSLQLSFGAMLGMLLVTPRIYSVLRPREGGKGKRTFARTGLSIWRALAASLAASLGAMIFTTPLVTLYFGYVSLVGVLANLLIFWAVSAAFILGYLACILGFVWLLPAKVLGFFARIATSYMIEAIRLCTLVPYGVLYARSGLVVLWLGLVYLVFLLCWLGRRKSGFRPVLPLCLTALSLCCLILLTEWSAGRGECSVTLVDVGQGASLVIEDGRATAVIDCGGKGTLTNAGDRVSSLLLSRGRRQLDLLLLTHFDEDHVNGVLRLMSRVPVRQLVIPGGWEENTERAAMLQLAEARGTQVKIVDKISEISADKLQITCYPGYSRKEKSLLYLVRIGDIETLVTGDAESSEEKKLLAAHSLPDGELFVAGHHGSKHSSSEALISAFRAESALVSAGYNSYGHPSQEALDRFARAGMQIYRTDIEGDIRFIIRREGG